MAITKQFLRGSSKFTQCQQTLKIEIEFTNIIKLDCKSAPKSKLQSVNIINTFACI